MATSDTACPRAVLHSSEGVSICDLSSATFTYPTKITSEALSCTWNHTGAYLCIVNKDEVQLWSSAAESVVLTIPEPEVSSVVFSPLSTFLVSWKRKSGDRANLKVWEVASGRLLLEFSNRSFQLNTPPVQWSADERILFRLSNEGHITALPGNCTTAVDAISRIPGDVEAFKVGPGGPPYGLVTFTPKTKSMPGCASLFAFPSVAAPVASRSMEADEFRAEFSADGKMALVEMRTASSAASYYGDSRLFLMSLDGKVSVAVPTPKEGPVHDFAWNPKGESFISIIGKSPPMATLHSRSGVPTFSFGTGSFNTVAFQPQGRFVVLAGFGNMSGPLQVYDVNKCKAVSAQFAPRVATSVSWSACGRELLTVATTPRLKVDNGATLWSYKGEQLAHFSAAALYAVSPQPGSFPDRPASPLHTSSSATVAVAKAPAKYVPPHLRGVAAKSTVSELMSADHKAAGKITREIAPIGAGSGVVGDLTAMSDSARKRAKARAKKEAEAKEAELRSKLTEILSPTDVSPAVEPPTKMDAEAVEADPEKELKRLNKKIKQIEELCAKQASGVALNEDQLKKITDREDIETRILQLRSALLK